MPTQTHSAEDNLLDYAVRLTHHRSGRKVLFIALTALDPRNRAGGHWRLVDGVLSPVILRHGGEFFRLRCGDAVAVFTTLDRALADRLSNKLAQLFRDDPLFEALKPDAPNPLCTWWDLTAEYDTFLAQAHAIKEAADDPSGPKSIHQAPDREDRLPYQPGTTEPAQLPLIAWLRAPQRGAAGLAALARTTSVIRWQPGSPPLRFGEFVERLPEAIQELGIAADDLERNPSLEAPFQGHIDRRLLVELPKARPNSAVLTVSIRLEALLGPEFLAFHDEWALGAWSPVTWLTPQDDAEASPKAFSYVRDMLMERGHRLGIGPLSLDVAADLEIERFKPALIALRWNARRVPDEGTRNARRLVSWFGAGAADLTLLCSCDTRDATTRGRVWGIGLFEGKQAEALVRGAAAS